MRSLQTTTFVVYFSLIMIILGGTIFSVMIEYPNWFANVPASLEATRNFYQVLHPGYFFQTLVPLFMLSSAAFLIVGWRHAGVRNLVLISVVLMLAAELLTFFYIYPRLGVMFGPEAAGHSVDALKMAASDFTFADRIRTVLGIIASAISVGALIRFFEPGRDDR